MKTTSVGFSEAKTHLSRYGHRAETGDSILVLKHGRPAFVIAPLPPLLQERPKKPGIVRGQIRMAPDFDRTPEEVIEAFEGKS